MIFTTEEIETWLEAAFKKMENPKIPDSYKQGWLDGVTAVRYGFDDAKRLKRSVIHSGL